MTILLADIGNTSIKIACFDKRRLLNPLRISLDDSEEMRKGFLKMKDYKPSAFIHASVSGFPPDFEKIADMISAPIRVIDHSWTTPVKSNYQPAQSLGIDRWANIIGAGMHFPKKNVLVIDAGTCLKFDLITEDLCYQGGSIAPGIDMRFKALNHYTSALPLVTRKSIPDKLTGSSTKASIESGVLNGIMMEIRCMLSSYRKNMDLEVVLTGGDSVMMENELEMLSLVDPWFTLRGLNEIRLFNEN